MNTAIYKFEVPIGYETSIGMKPGAEILHVGLQRGEIKLWVKQNLDVKETVFRRFQVYPTGHIGWMPDTAKHVASVVTADGTYVWHVFEHV